MAGGGHSSVESCRRMAESFRGHHELLDANVFDEVHNEWRWRPLGEGRRWAPEEDNIVTDVRRGCVVNVLCNSSETKIERIESKPCE